MLAAIVGGKLQGLEVVSLARKAGWRTLLLDKKAGVPAALICDEFHQVDVRQRDALTRALIGVDLVIPALENREALDALVAAAGLDQTPLAFDPDAYAISSSKIASDRLFASLGIAAPVPWPRCGFPAVAKPSGASGSTGVVILKDEAHARAVFPDGLPERGWVLQQYLPGPSYSIEVIGRPGCYYPLQVTELFMDAGHDCKRVAAPSQLSDAHIQELERLSVRIAEAIELTGLMDVEVILHQGTLKVLEIDARFPSQTPLAVEASTGCNMVALLGEIFLNPSFTVPPMDGPGKGAILEHIRVSPRAICVEGEHIMTTAGPLARITDFFGADEALTNWREGAREWVATLIVTGETRLEAMQKRQNVLAAIQRQFAIEILVDRFPEENL